MSRAESKPVASGAPPSRRSYLGWLMGLCTAGVGAVLAVPLIRFSLYPLRAKTTEVKWSEVGPASDFASITSPVQRPVTVEQVDGWHKTISEKIVYVTKNPQGQLEVLSAVCPHLGCSVQWRGSNKSLCVPVMAPSSVPTEPGWAVPRRVAWTRSKARRRTVISWSGIGTSGS